MHILESYIQHSLPIAWIVIIISFIFLFKCADIFVDSAIAVAKDFKIPKILIGLLLVSIATSVPELCVSMIAAFKGSPKIALGNAVGSVICNEGLALSLAGILAVSSIAIVPSVLKSSGIFLIIISVLAYAFVFLDQTLNRMEGVILVFLFAGYLFFLFKNHLYQEPDVLPEQDGADNDVRKKSLAKHCCFFAFSLLGIIIASDYIVVSATVIARSFQVSESIIAMTLVAFGTSVPEVATSITAARKGEGAIAVGNILGSDIINICLVAGASAIANDLILGARDISFMFPVMIIMVVSMFCMLRNGNSLTRSKGFVLLSFYLIYLAACVYFFPPTL